MQAAEPAEIIHSVVMLAQHSAAQQHVTVEMVSEERDREIECDPEQIKQLLLNLILNAVQASSEGGRVTIRSFFAAEALCVEISDNGCGIPAEERDKIFDPFFTTKENGTGLGLAIAANIAAQHGGSLTCEPNSDRGATFRLELPVSAALLTVKKTKAAAV
jgi:signal transduction histidine kinase